MSKAQRKGAVYRRLSAQARNSATTCSLCWRPIDTTLPPSHAAGPSADHVVALANGGALHGQMVGVHTVCNLRRGSRDPSTVDFNRPLEYDTPPPGRAQPRHSQQW